MKSKHWLELTPLASVQVPGHPAQDSQPATTAETAQDSPLSKLECVVKQNVPENNVEVGILIRHSYRVRHGYR